MRHVNRFYIGLLCLLPLLAACIDEDIVKTYNIEEGIPVTTSLRFGVKGSRIVSRTAASSTTEQYVQNLFIIAFTSNGSISGDGTNSGKMLLEDVNNSTGSGSIENFKMLSGSGQYIYAIANIGTGYNTLTTEQLQNFRGTRSDFLELTSSLTDNYKTDVDRGAFLMSGELSDVTIDEKGNFLNQTTTPNIPLNRLEARITFRIKVDNSEHSNISFTPNYYVVENISQGTYLFPHEKDEGADNSWDYTTEGYDSMSKHNEYKHFDTPNNDEGYSIFEFYVWENRLTPKRQITQQAVSDTNAESLYALREKRNIDGNATPDGNKNGQEYVLSDNFTYANDNSTYVVIYGTLNYTEDNRTVTATAAYTVHLGSTGNSSTDNWYNDPTLANNYDTERNTHYTYTVTLSGVESMRVEVQKDKESRPGVEGDVIVTNEIFDCDAHYGRAHFTLTRAAVKEGLSWSISTPFQNGTKTFDANNYLVNGNIGTEKTLANEATLKTGLLLNDYRWVQFVINAEAIKKDGNKVAHDEFAKYPGHLAYDGGSGTATQAPAFGSATGYYYNGTTAYYSSAVKMYDVNQLINHLYIEANNSYSSIFLAPGTETVSQDENAVVTITAFIDEYVYIYNPKTTYYKAPGSTENKEDLLLWQNVVNGENRTLSISGSGTQYSPDGNTSWTETDITFSQRPIYTIYNPTTVGTAWGTESIMETDKLSTTDAPTKASSNSMSNGRSNTLAIVPSGSNILRWSDVLSLEHDGQGSLKDDYNNIWYACLGRNRDLNGDDIVQADEIRWYLASIDQLTDLWIGEAAIPNARLYDVDKNVTGKTVKIDHVASSSLFAANNVWVIWAEEGASRGERYKSGGEGSSDYNGSTYNYRCVRNLGIALANSESEPDDYVQLSQGTYRSGWTTYNEYRINVSRLNTNTLRTGTAGINLEPHTERGNLNRPSREFAVISNSNSYSNSNGVYNVSSSFSTITGDNYNPCPTGYRLPNQRELLLLTMYFGNNSSTGYSDLFTTDRTSNVEYVCRTGFGFNNYSYDGNANKDGTFTNRPGFTFDIAGASSTFRLFNGTSGTFRARCVRDVVN